jgi:serine phosphatase RsbU (regulator of sigma subunit)
VTEALDPEERFYTLGRLTGFLTGVAGQSAERIVRATVQDVRMFCGAHEQADDLTLLAARWMPSETGLPPSPLSLSKADNS